MPNGAAEGRRVLVAAPFGRDAETVRGLLEGLGYDVGLCNDIDAVAARIDDRIGAVLLTEETVAADLTALKATMDAQPTWSMLPFILLAAPQTGRLINVALPRKRLGEFIGNLVVLERPLGAVSLVSAVESSMRARQRQFELRDRLDDLAASRKALQDSEAELRLIADSLPGLIAFIDVEFRYRFANAAYKEWVGRSPADVVGRHVREIIGEEAFKTRLPAMQRALDGHDTNVEITMQRLDGKRRDAEVRYLPRFDDSGDVIGFHVFAIDITERMRAAEALRNAAETLEQKVAERTRELQAEMASRQQAEAALRQSQKMEAVGQLTGGIAHDFNNMLTGIIGSLDIVKRRIASGRVDGLNRFMDAAFSSAQRAASLTQRLLAFSRRQSLDSRPLDVNGLLNSLEDLLLRTLSERIVLRLVLPKGLPAVIADENQLETAILNLVINSRDAMPAGGHLTIETSSVEVTTSPPGRASLKPGKYVVISVTDDGAGMPPDVLEKVFDPFFTTKPIGQGTGLGLSMVYGFAEQSGGQVRIHSRLGEGTTVNVYLPSTAREALDAPVVDEPVAPAGQGQTVLVVEDDDSVRLLVLETLAELGYRALESRDPFAAMPFLSSSRTIDLMISDVGLPGMSGRDLAEFARKHRPTLPILFITGYAENAADRGQFLGTNMSMITKPFDLKNLAVRINEIVETAAVREDALAK